MTTDTTIDTLDSEHARALVEQIRYGLDEIRESVLALWQGQGWLALGYSNWADLCAAEFPFRLSLQRDERRELVGQLADRGMSTRAIAPVVGVDQSGVVRDRQVMRDTSPDSYVDTETGEVIAAGRIVGLDGKEYHRPDPLSPEERARLENLRKEREDQSEREKSIRAANFLAAECVYKLNSWDYPEAADRFLTVIYPRQSEFVEPGMRLTRERVETAIEFLNKLLEVME